MRRKDREITDPIEIDAILGCSTVCRIAFAVDGGAYIVPLSHGYDAQARALFFHTASEGRKIDCIAASPRVCFEVEGHVEIAEGNERACSWGVRYESVIGFGTIVEVMSPQAKDAALRLLTEQQAGRTMDWMLDAKAVAGTRVWRLDIESMTGKRSFKPEQEASV